MVEEHKHLVKNDDHIFEVDEFYGQNHGLVIAEIELKVEEDKFLKPFWLEKEVTGDIRYYKSQLSKNPYLKWEALKK